MARRTRDTGERRPRQVPVALQEESAPERWLRTLRVSGFSVIALVLLDEEPQARREHDDREREQDERDDAEARNAQGAQPAFGRRLLLHADWDLTRRRVTAVARASGHGLQATVVR
jgi:hypothetical protein